MRNLQKIIATLILTLGISELAIASHQVPKDQQAKNAMAKCDDLTGIFLQEWIEGEQRLNTFIKLKDVSEPLNFTDQVSRHLETSAPQSDIEIGCLQANEGVAIRYENSENLQTIIQIDNDGRLQTYEETAAFQVDVVKSFKFPNSLIPKE